jgi:hypothetical protein
LRIASTTRGWKKGGVNSGFSEKGDAGNYAEDLFRTINNLALKLPRASGFLGMLFS